MPVAAAPVAGAVVVASGVRPSAVAGGASVGSTSTVVGTVVGAGFNFSSPPHECAVSSPFWGTIPELIEVINLAQAGKVKMLVEHFSLDHAGEAYDRLHHGTIQGRAVITPHG